MSTQHSSGQSLTDDDRTQLETYRVLDAGDQHQYVGIDDDGYLHHLDRQTGTVHRVHPAQATRQRVVDLTERPERPADALEVYVHEYVADQIGWAVRELFTARDIWGDSQEVPR
jgi:hypothetical protein